MDSVRFAARFAPQTLVQPILPNWSLSLFSVNLGASPRPEVEHAVLQQVGSYGRQIGHLAEALEVVIDKLALLDDAGLPPAARDALKVFLGEVAAVRSVKAEARGSDVV